MKDNYTKPVTNLIEDEKPIEWINWLFDLQNSLISYGHLEGMSKKGAEEFSSRFWALKNFFKEIDNLKETENEKMKNS
jgi:hypothetical protein